MNIALVQLNPIVGEFSESTQKIIQHIQRAYAQGADLVVFPELILGGYPAFDWNDNPEFRAACKQMLTEISMVCTEVGCLIGGMLEKGAGLYNAAYFLHQGTIHTVCTKKKLRPQGADNEEAYFLAGSGIGTLSLKNTTIAVGLGEDAYTGLQNSGDSQPDGLVILNNQLFSYLSHSGRLSRISSLAKELKIPVLELNIVGGQGELLYAGASICVDADGLVSGEAKAFQEDVCIYQLESRYAKPLQERARQVYKVPELMHEALIMGIKDFFLKQGFTQAVLGLSGGLDSALVAALASKALGAENVHCLLMPSEFSTAHSIQDAQQLADNLNLSRTVLPIKEIYSSFQHSLEPLFRDLPFGLAEENLQARTRGSLVMAVSNKFGSIVLNTSNKSEAAMGYGTLYGDLVGSLSVLGDVYKTQAYDIARYINANKTVIPENILTKAPSAELRPGQKDSDSLPEYDRLDPVLFQYVDLKKSVQEICEEGYDRTFVSRIARTVDAMEFKRHQTPPALSVSDQPLGRGRRIPEVKAPFPMQ